MGRSLAIARHEMRVLRGQLGSLVTLIVMPCVLITFLLPVSRATGIVPAGGNGSEFAVPAMTVMFAFFLVGFVGFSFFSEHRYNTWERLRASQARNAEIMVGKVLPALGVAFVQQTVMFVLGVAVFGLRIRGSVFGIALVAMAFATCLTSVGVLLAALLRNDQQLNIMSNLGAMVMSGLSGTFVPIEVLPGWAQTVAPAMPQYWALRGFRSMILEGNGLGAAVLPVLVLFCFTLALATIALFRFRFDEPKVARVF